MLAILSSYDTGFGELDNNVRTFVKKHDQNVKIAKAYDQSPDKKLKNLMWGRPLIVGPVIDKKVWKFMVLLYEKGNHISRSIVATPAMFLLSRTDDESVENVIATSTLGRILSQRIWFRRRTATSGKVEIPDSTKKEASLQQYYHITSIAEKHNIPELLMISSDQTPSIYFQVGRFTMAPQGAKKVGMVGIADKRINTLTLTVTVDGKTLPYQAIYQKEQDIFY